MNDLRRIGKTQIMVKMHAEPPVGWLVVKSDLGGIYTAAEFATEAFRISANVLGAKRRVLRTMDALLKRAEGVEIAGILKLPDGTPAPWKEVLRRTFADVDAEMAALGTGKILFLWDEVPYLIERIAAKEGAETAMEVLDMLRALGQDHDHVRLLLTGSIGLHHVLGLLKTKGYNGSPLNRMELVQPGPIDNKTANKLAERLLKDSAARCRDIDQCAEDLAQAVGYVPFYIHKLISRLPAATPLTSREIQDVLDRELMSEQNDWDLRHYRDRLGPYYQQDEKLALCILDALAGEEPQDFKRIRSLVNAQIAADDERLRELLKLLCMDHYLVRTPENQYRYHLSLIRRWWKLYRSL